MRYIDLPYLGKISRIGIGTGRFGSVLDRGLSFELLDIFFENGGNLIDTARNYYEWTDDGRGKSERTIGEWLSNRGFRNKAIISTKGGVSNIGTDFTIDLSRDNLLREAGESLETLDTDYIDIYYLHRDEENREVSEIMYTLSEIRDYIGCAYVGVSNWSLDRLKEANEYAINHGLPRIDTVQLCWSIADYTYAMWNDPTVKWMNADTYKYLGEEGMFALAFTSQAKGFFQKAIAQGYENIDAKLKERVASDENLKRLDIIKAYCDETNIAPTAVVNGYITQNRLPSVALIGCSSTVQLESILSSADTPIDGAWLSQFDPA